MKIPILQKEFVKDLIEKVDVRNCGQPMRKKVMTHIIQDRFGCQIQRIIQSKLEGENIQPKAQQFVNKTEKV